MNAAPVQRTMIVSFQSTVATIHDHTANGVPVPFSFVGLPESYVPVDDSLIVSSDSDGVADWILVGNAQKSVLLSCELGEFAVTVHAEPWDEIYWDSERTTELARNTDFRSMFALWEHTVMKEFPQKA